MQSQVIESILRVEDEAQSIVENAEKEARERIFKAENEAKEFIKEEVDKIKKRNEEIIKGREEALSESLKSYEEDKEALNNLIIDEEKIELSAAKIVSLLTSFGA